MTQAASTKQQVPLIGKLIIRSSLVVETGLHIGGGGETLDIGGLDKPVIRNPLDKHPYIPGSSIKGKLRALLERSLPDISLNRKSQELYRHECDHIESWQKGPDSQAPLQRGAKDCPICRVFGSTGRECFVPTGQTADQTTGQTLAKKTGENKPARLIVRDSQLAPESAKLLQNIDTGLYMTEWKFENGIDRITAAANPRQVERVPAGSEFNFEMVYTVEDEAQAVEDMKHLAIALAILEDDALGGHGSRGYGKVQFKNFRFFYRGVEQYQQAGTPEANWLTPFYEPEDTAALLNGFAELSNQINTRLLPETSDGANGGANSGAGGDAE